jgi:hypothetical protein
MPAFLAATAIALTIFQIIIRVAFDALQRQVLFNVAAGVENRHPLIGASSNHAECFGKKYSRHARHISISQSISPIRRPCMCPLNSPREIWFAKSPCHSPSLAIRRGCNCLCHQRRNGPVSQAVKGIPIPRFSRQMISGGRRSSTARFNRYFSHPARSHKLLLTPKLQSASGIAQNKLRTSRL